MTTCHISYALFDPVVIRPVFACRAEILPYLPQLVSGLGAVLAASKPDVQELALSALASIVSASGAAFEPYMGTAWVGRHAPSRGCTNAHFGT